MSNSDDENFEVEKIVDRGEGINNVLLYRVRWLGYSENEDTWEPIENLQHCLQLVEDFERQYTLAQEENKRKRRRTKPKPYVGLGRAPPPPIKDDFWKKADEGLLPLENTSLYEKVKRRSLNFKPPSNSQHISLSSVHSAPRKRRRSSFIESEDEKAKRKPRVDNFLDCMESLLEKCRNGPLPSPIVAKNSVLKKTNLSFTTDSMDCSTTDVLTSTPVARRRYRSEKCVRFAEQHQVFSDDKLKPNQLKENENVQKSSSTKDELKKVRDINVKKQSMDLTKRFFPNAIWEQIVNNAVLKELKVTSSNDGSNDGSSSISKNHPILTKALVCSRPNDSVSKEFNVERSEDINSVALSFPVITSELNSEPVTSDGSNNSHSPVNVDKNSSKSLVNDSSVDINNSSSSANVVVSSSSNSPANVDNNVLSPPASFEHSNSSSLVNVDNYNLSSHASADHSNPSSSANVDNNSSSLISVGNKSNSPTSVENASSSSSNVENNSNSPPVSVSNNNNTSLSRSPDIVVHIDIVSGNGDSNDNQNTATSFESPLDGAIVQNVEVSPETKSSYRNIYNILHKKFHSEVSTVQVLQAYSQLLTHFRQRMKNYVYPIHYFPTSEETDLLANRLKLAVEGRNFDEIEYLLTRYRPFELNAHSIYNGQSILVLCCSMACTSDHDMCDIIRFLLQYGVDPNFKNANSFETALFTAVKQGHICQVKLLLWYNTDPDAVNASGESPLLTAIRDCNKEENVEDIVKLLLQYGADYVFDGNKYYYSIAEEYKKPNLVDVLNSHIGNLKQAFIQHLDKVKDSSIQIMDTIIDMRCLKLKSSVNWTFNFNITEVNLPKGYGACLFLALVEFDKYGMKFSKECQQYIKEIQFNNAILHSVFKNSKNIFWLQPLMCGRNELIVQMAQIPNLPKAKLVVQANVIQILPVPSVVANITNDCAA